MKINRDKSGYLSEYLNVRNYTPLSERGSASGFALCCLPFGKKLCYTVALAVLMERLNSLILPTFPTYFSSAS